MSKTKKCIRCGGPIVMKGVEENWHKQRFCSWVCQVKYGDEAVDRVAKRIGRQLGEIYNPEIER